MLHWWPVPGSVVIVIVTVTTNIIKMKNIDIDLFKTSNIIRIELIAMENGHFEVRAPTH